MGEIDEKKIGQLELDDFVNAIPGIYKKYDRERSIWDVWLHTNHHASAIGEEVRKNKPGGALLEEIADFSMWLFTFLGKLEGKLGTRAASDLRLEEPLIRISRSYSDLLWCKYPGMCPVCYWRRTKERMAEADANFRSPCDCLLHEVESREQGEKKKHVLALRAFAAKNDANKPKSVDDWQEMFSRVFRANLRHLNLTDIAFHLLEELGEVSDAMVRMYSYSKMRPIGENEPVWRQIWLEEEISDVSSWLFALIQKLDFVRQTAHEYDKWRFKEDPLRAGGPFLLSQIIWRRYGSDDLKSLYCPHCRKDRCDCEIELCQNPKQVARVLAAYKNGLDARGASTPPE